MPTTTGDTNQVVYTTGSGMIRGAASGMTLISPQAAQVWSAWNPNQTSSCTPLGNYVNTNISYIWSQWNDLTGTSGGATAIPTPIASDTTIWLQWTDDLGTSAAVTTSNNHTSYLSANDANVIFHKWYTDMEGRVTHVVQVRACKEDAEELNFSNAQRNLATAKRSLAVEGDAQASVACDALNVVLSNFRKGQVVPERWFPIIKEANELIGPARERAQRHRDAQVRAAEENKKVQEAAAKRAEGLLLANLTLEQRAAYKKERTFIVNGSHGGRFKLMRGYSHNVKELDEEGREVRTFCIHPPAQHPCPNEDNVLLQKLMLQTDEEEFRRIANARPLIGDGDLTALDNRRRQRARELVSAN